MKHTGPAGPFAAVIFSLAFLSVPLSAQQGTLRGRVIDAETGVAIQGAAVEALGVTGTQVTNASGQFQLSVAPGSYSVVVSLIGFETARIDGVSVAAGETRSVDISMRSRAFILNPVVVTASRRQEKSLDAPASIAVVSAEQIARVPAATPMEHVRSLPGVDMVQTGLTQSNVVARGFNNVFSGALLTIQDNRYARVPSLRLNANNMIPATDLDIERIEVSLGPGAALYGPNAASGVLHIITSSPLDRQGSSISLAGGERSLMHGQFRTAHTVSERIGFKISGQYFSGTDWTFVDPVEVAAAEADPSNLRIGNRNPDNERYSTDARVDMRFDNGSELVLAGGLNVLSSIELTGVGAGQTEDWKYSYFQSRFTKGRLFAQAFLNQSDAGGSFLLRTGNPLIDKSRSMAVQVQHGLEVGEAQSFTYGIDLQKTEPRTEGSITGRNEDDDNISEAGAYLHSETALSDRFDLVAAFRVDYHNRLEDLNFSPRVALVFKPQENQNFRLTFNRAFSTPTTNNLFLDLVAGNIPLSANLRYDIRTRGVPTSGFTFRDRCTGGLNDLCMRSPFMAGQLPANASLFWDALVTQFVPAALQPALSNPGAAPGDPALGTVLRRFDQVAAQTGGNPFPIDGTPLTDIVRIQSTIYNTFEVGYKGIIGNRVLLAADVYRQAIQDFVGPLRVETPSVFLDPSTTQAFVMGRLGALIQGGLVQPEEAVAIITGLLQVPLGTVVPDQADTSDLLLTYRNFGDVDLWGADVSAQFLVTDRVTLGGAYSFVSEECFDFNEDGSCTSSSDIALNAPTNKGSVSFSFQDQASGFDFQTRVRATGGFPMNSGVYVGTVDNYTVFDLSAGYRIPMDSRAVLSLSATNLFDKRYTAFIGAPAIGRMILLRLRYDF